jgi:hypothetical protein
MLRAQRPFILESYTASLLSLVLHKGRIAFGWFLKPDKLSRLIFHAITCCSSMILLLVRRLRLS